MDKKLLDLYTDYLIVSTSQTTAVGLSNLLDKEISHDKITRFLSKEDFNGKYLWKEVKNKVRQVEKEDGVLVFDDTIEAKTYTDENDLICWHWDHSINSAIKGVNQLSLIYYVEDMTIPVGVEFIKKTELRKDEKTGKISRYSKKDKNEYLREMLDISEKNKIKYKYVLMDSWYFNSGNINHIKVKKQKDFIVAYKTTTHVFLSKEDIKTGNNLDVSKLIDKESISVYIKNSELELKMSKHVLKEQDGKEAVLYLITSDLTLDAEGTLIVYKKRWKIEEFFKVMKSICSYSKSPTGTVKTQINHFFCSICSVFKLEVLRKKSKDKINHFFLKNKIYMSGLKKAFETFIAYKTEVFGHA
jgi:hypothetical protein